MPYVSCSTGRLTMFESAMTELGLRPGQWVDDDLFWECISANARALCRDIDQARERGEDVPDISDLADKCGHTGTQ